MAGWAGEMLTSRVAVGGVLADGEYQQHLLDGNLGSFASAAGHTDGAVAARVGVAGSHVVWWGDYWSALECYVG